MHVTLCFLVFLSTINSVGCSCQFPADLRSHSWYTTSNGVVAIPADGGTMTNYASAITSGILTLTCEEYDSTTDRYIATTPFTVFGTTRKAFFCMKFTKLSAMKYFLTYDTDIETSTSLVRVVVINNSSATLTPSQACALTSTQPTGTHELFIRTDSVATSTVSCPGSLNFNFTAATMQSSDCSGNLIYGASSVSQHTYSYASCITSKYSSNGVFDCVYSITEGAYTYVNVFNNDSTVDESATYRYLCYVLWSSGNVVYFTYHPKICQPTQTPTTTGSDNGVAVVAYYNSSDDVDSQIAVGVIFGLFLLALIVATVVFLVLFLVGNRKPKPTKTPEDKTKTKSKSKHTTDNKTKHKKKKDKKRTKKNRKENVDENQNIDVSTNLSRKDSFWEKNEKSNDQSKWTDFVGISTAITEFKKPLWQKKWEEHRDPVWGKTIVYSDGSETARSTDSVISTSKIVWAMPEKEEENQAKSLWEKVYRLWFEPRKTIPENKFLEMQKLAKLAKPKHVRFKGPIKKNNDETVVTVIENK